jgi:hypothetical protein
MEVGTQNVHSAHPVAVQANLRTEMQIQDRGSDSVPPVSSSNKNAETSTEVDNTKTQGRYLDTKA